MKPRHVPARPVSCFAPSRFSVPALGLALVFALSTLLVACGSPETTSERGEAAGANELPPPAVSVGSEAPPFTLPTLDGEEVRLADHAGQVVLLDFWATWCGPCHEQTEILGEVWKEYEGRNAVFYGVDSGESAEVVREFVEQNPFPYTVLLDEDDAYSYEVEIISLPTLIIVDTEGRVAFFHEGIVQAPRLREALDAAGA